MPLSPEIAVDDVRVLVNGQLYSGWQSVRVTRSIEALCGSFELAFTDRWAMEMAAWAIAKGDGIEVYIGADLVLTGWVDAFSGDISSDNHVLRVEGRDITCDIVDCSVTKRPGSWSNTYVESIMAEICAPYGVQVVADVDTGGPVKQFRVQPTGKCFDELERLAKGRQLMLCGSPDGVIHLKQYSAAPLGVTLREGENVLIGQMHDSDEQRYSRYECEGQGDGQKKAAHSVRQVALDAGMRRFRQLNTLAEDSADEGYSANRAEWEMRIRGSRSFSADITVQGWRMPSGKLWPVDGIVGCEIPSFRMSGEFLINGVVFQRSDQGTTTLLELRKPDFTWKYKKNKKPRSLVSNH